MDDVLTFQEYLKEKEKRIYEDVRLSANANKITRKISKSFIATVKQYHPFEIKKECKCWWNDDEPGETRKGRKVVDFIVSYGGYEVGVELKTSYGDLTWGVGKNFDSFEISYLLIPDELFDSADRWMNKFYPYVGVITFSEIEDRNRFCVKKRAQFNKKANVRVRHREAKDLMMIMLDYAEKVAKQREDER